MAENCEDTEVLKARRAPLRTMLEAAQAVNAELEVR